MASLHGSFPAGKAREPASLACARSGLALGSHPELTLGDKVKVKLVAADLDRKTLDFKFV